jgi:hypothetical protein
MTGLVRGLGVALLLGGALLILTNVVFTPLLPADQGEEVVRTSTVYLYRLSLAGLAAVLILFGCFGVHLAQRSVSGRFGTAAFLIAFVGNSLLVAVEWSNIFVLRALAQVSPAALTSLDESRLMTAGFALAAGLFTLGWLLLAISVWRTGRFSRWVAPTVIAGLVLIVVLSGSPLGETGAIVGNAVFGLGLIGLGRNLTGRAGEEGVASEEERGHRE